MDLLLVAVSDPAVDRQAPSAPHGRPPTASCAASLRAAGAGALDLLEVATTQQLDAALSELGGRRLVIAADQAGLARVLTRMLRAGILGDAETAVLTSSSIGYLQRVGLPADLGAQARIAVDQPARLVGVVKDDSGGVCVDSATLGPWRGRAARRPRSESWWLRAVVDDQRLADGPVRSLTMRRLGPDVLEARVRLGRLRQRTLRGRSLQLACDEAYVQQDGIVAERPRRKRTLWSEPALWRLAVDGSRADQRP